MRLKGECAQSGRGPLEQAGSIAEYGLGWLDENQLAEKDTLERVLKDTEPIVSRLLARARARGRRVFSPFFRSGGGPHPLSGL